MTISGTIITALPEVSGTSKSGKAWRKREYIVEYEHGQYPKSVVFQVMGDNIDKLNIQQGVEYDLEIDFEAREWNGRYFLQASCWKATPKNQSQPAPAPANNPYAAMGMQPREPHPQPAPAQDDGLPF